MYAFRLNLDEQLVSVYVNGFLSSCSSECIFTGQSCTKKCKFDYDSNLTPVLASVSSKDENGDTILIIIGENFSDNKDDYVITVGNDTCTVKSATSTEVQCMLVPGPAGIFKVGMVIKSQGVATQPQSGDLEHEVKLTITGNKPVKGSVGGGTRLTVNGTGFPNSLEGWENSTLTVAGLPCDIIKSSYNSLECITTEGTDMKQGPVEATINSKVASGGDFTYDPSVSPAITSFSPSSATPLGGGNLTIIGSSLGKKWGKVFIGKEECRIIKWTETNILCKIPKNQHGNHRLIVEVKDKGTASTSSVPAFVVTFKVTGIAPAVGSNLGGTVVTVTGEGFGNCSNVQCLWETQWSVPLRNVQIRRLDVRPSEPLGRL